MAGEVGVLTQLVGLIKYLSADKETKLSARDIIRANSLSNVSLASRARANMCQFPILASSRISSTTYRKVSEILEQLYAQYLNLVIYTQLDTVNVDKSNKLEVISKIHQNDNAMSSNLDYDKLYGTYSETVELSNIIKEALPFLEAYNFSKDDLNKANKELSKLYSENFNLQNLNQVTNLLREDEATNKEYETIYSKHLTIETELLDLQRELEIKQNEYYSTQENHLKKEIEILKEQIKNKLEVYKSSQNLLNTIANKKNMLDEQENKRVRDALAADKELREKDKYKREVLKDMDNNFIKEQRRQFRKNFGSLSDFSSNIIRKTNQVDPTMLTVNMKYYTSSGEFENVTLTLAVKTVTHLIDADEMYLYIDESLNKDKFVFRALQVLTGEKEFSFRFLFSMDKAKRDAAKDTVASKWWRHLKDRRTASWLKVARGNDPYVPNATLVMSMDDYEAIKLYYGKKSRNGVNSRDLLKDVKLAYKLTDLLFLMHLVVVDDVNDEIFIFNKDTRNWESYTLGKLQSEIATMNKLSNQKAMR